MNELKKQYDEMLDGFKTSSIKDWMNYDRKENMKMIHAASYIVTHCEETLFADIQQARYHYQNMRNLYKKWKRGGIGDKHAFKMFVEHAYNLSAMHLPNPFEDNEYELDLSLELDDMIEINLEE